MFNLTESEQALASKFVGEFSRQLPADDTPRFECFYRSHGFPNSRMVLKVQSVTRTYALKIDTESPASGRLNDEFDLLTKLSTHFDGNKTSQVVHPIYISPGGAFFVTEFIDRPTAVDLIYNSKDDDQVAQVFRRAGSWLNDLHGFRPAEDYAFRPKWMTDSVQNLFQSLPLELAEESQRMVNTMLAEAERLKGVSDIRVFSHGDFHGLNLIVGQGQTIGLDFTEARDKLAVYDIVDFLKSDIFRDGAGADVDRSGILKRNKEMFFRLYRHPINIEILDFCIRGRLLKDWLRLCQPDHKCSDFEDHMRTRLGIRLKQAFR